MDLDALRQALLAFEDRGNARFSMPASTAPVPSWTSIHDLYASALAGATLTITGITAWPPAHVTNAIVYRGTATLFPWTTGTQATLTVTAWFTVDAAGAPQVAIEALAPSGWHLGDSLAGLPPTAIAAVAFDRATFVVTSTATTHVDFPGPVPVGINLSGELTIAGPLARAGILLGDADARAVAGPIDLGPGSMPVIAVRPRLASPSELGGLSASLGVELVTLYKTFPTPPSDPVLPPYPIDRTAAVVYLKLGDGTPIELAMPLLATGDAMTLALANGPIPIAGVDVLAPLTDGQSIAPILANVVPPIRGLALRDVGIAVDLGDGTTTPERGAAWFDIALDTGGWNLLPNGILTLDEIGARARVDFTLANAVPSGSLYGTITIVDTMRLAAAIALPGQVLSITLDDDQPVSVAELLAQFAQKLVGRTYRPPIDMTIVTLDMTVDIPSGEFQLYGRILTPWSVALGSYQGGALITLGLTELSLEIDYSDSALGVGLGAVATIDTAQIVLSASTPGGDDAGWSLSARLRRGDKISVGKLLAAFMFPSGPPPGQNLNVPSLDITVLDLSLELDATSTPIHFGIAATIESTWSFQVLPGAPTLSLAAGCDLEGDRPSGGPWSISGSVWGGFQIYGVKLAAAYEFSGDNTSLTFVFAYGDRGLEATVAQQTLQGRAQTILTVRFGDLSLGEILEFLVGLALPGETRRLSSPWDVLYQINFRNLSLLINLDTNDVTVDYALNLDLKFASLEHIQLVYSSAGGDGSILIKLTGTFLGQPYGTDDTSEPLTWDFLNDPAPDVPGKGSGLIDIRYVGLGQHLALPVPIDQLKTVDDVIEQLTEVMGPPAPSGDPLSSPTAASIRYDANSKWLFGISAALLDDFITLSAVFFDPYLYGGVIELKGERAGPLAGLRFELLYRRISDNIGELSVDLRVPDQFRTIELGEVSITLGIIHVDIYTNGNFRVNLGFPTGGDFSSSFGVQVFPFIGQGGLYLAYLDGATSERVPTPINGTFSPVIEAGLGLAVGVGKEIHLGPLSGGVSLEVLGIFEGIYAPYHGYDASAPKDTYFWLQGTVGIVGKLYAEVDFVVVKASVNLVARATAQLTIEAHEPIQIDLDIQVTARASIKILFIRIHFSFEISLHVGFTIGSHTAAPWVKRAPSTLLDVRADAPARPRLRQQRSQAPARRILLAAPPLAHRLAAPRYAPWAPAAVYGPGAWKTCHVQFIPGFTIADPSTVRPIGTRAAADPPGNALEVVLLFAAENTVSPTARPSTVAQVARDHLHQVDDQGNPAFTSLIETMLRWAALAGAGVSGAQVLTVAQLATLLDALEDPDFIAATFAYHDQIESLFEQSLHFDVVNCPSTGPIPDETSATFVPIIPAITATVVQGTQTLTRDYAAFAPTGSAYATNLAAYVAQLATDTASSTAPDPMQPPAPAPTLRAVTRTAAGTDPSMASLVFGEYAAIVTRAAVQAAADVLASYPYPYPASNGPTLRWLAAQFGDQTRMVARGKGQDVADAAHAHGVSARALAALHPDGFADDAITVAVPIVTATTIAQDNQAAPLATVSFNVTALPYQVRAGQTLTAIAAAIPQQVAAADPAHDILGPIAPAQIAVRNQSLDGFLRAAATLTIPAFSYTRLSGDTDDFLAAFFAVRNLGVGGIDRTDWYAQAIAILNPDPALDWSSLRPGTTLTVPSAYLVTTTTITYPVHQGDTLARVAATFTKFQASGAPIGPTPPTPYPVPAQSHPIAATDTLASLVVDFPGLALTDLIAANLTADVLGALATITLPDFGATTIANQTLAQLAAVFDLTMEDLVALVEDTANLFAPAGSGTPPVPPLAIRNVPSRSVDDLVAQVCLDAPANAIAAQVSRFLLHGLRAPAPDDTTFTSLTPAQVLDGDFHGKLWSLHDLAGTQLSWLQPATQPMTITLTSAIDWVNLHDATVANGRVRASAATTAITLTISDAEPFASQLPATSLLLGAAAAPMSLADHRPQRFALSSTIHWQAATRPPLTPSDTPGEPSIWPLSDSLCAAIAPAPATYGLYALPLDAPPDADGAALTAYTWAVSIPFAIHRVPTGDGSSIDTYVVEGADPSSVDLLYQLCVHLAAGDPGTTLYLLYPPSATSDNPRGLASDAIDDSVFVLETNLSTETRDSLRARRALADPPVVYSAAISDVARFTLLLWEASVVTQGGFYLRYRRGDAGLPDQVFDQSGRGTLYLLCVLGSQAGSPPSRGLLPFNNCAVVEDNVDASTTQIYAMRTDTGAPLVTLPIVPAGSVGFTITRPDPQPDPSQPITSAQRSQLLYNLFGYQTVDGGGFTASNEGVPVGPTDGDAIWTYQQVLAVATRASAAGRVAQHCPSLPPPDDDPYAGISASAAVSVALTAHDSFGNRAIASDPPSLPPIPVRYTDALVGVAEWPGVALSYTVDPGDGGGAPQLTIALGLRAASYLPGPGTDTAAALRTASAHALRYRRIFYQLGRPNLSIAVSTPLGPGGDASPLGLSLARFTSFVAGAFVFTDQLARAKPIWIETAANDTLKSIADAYSVTPTDLLTANADLDAAAVFATDVIVPQFDRVKHGESIAAFAQRHQLTSSELLTSYGNGAAPVSAGTSIAIPPRTIAVVAGQSLADFAAAAGCTVADLASANPTSPGLIADDTQWSLRGATTITRSATFASLVSVFAALGRVTTPGEIASANRDLIDPFVIGGPGYVVDHLTLTDATTIDALVAAHFPSGLDEFLARNGAEGGIIDANTALQIGATTQAAPSGHSVRGFAEQVLALSLAQFAIANATPGAPPPPTLHPGLELLAPALIDVSATTAAPYAVVDGQTLAALAAIAGTDPTTLATSIQDLAGVFVPQLSITIGTAAPITTTAEDSFASVLARCTPPQTLAALVAAIATRTPMLRPGMIVIVPAPRITSASTATSIAALAGQLAITDVVGLARSNAASDGFLDPQLSVTLGGQTVPIGPHGTLASVYARLIAAGASLDYDDFLTAAAALAIVRIPAATAPATTVLLPPPPSSAAAALPSDPAVTHTITVLSTMITVARVLAEVDPDLAGGDALARTTPVVAATSATPASYAAFAARLQSAYGGRLRVALGRPATAATGSRRQRLYVVRFDAPDAPATTPAIRALSLGTAPAFFALPPLSRQLLSRTAQVRTYVSGSDDPLPDTTTQRSFKSIDAQAWARDALDALDRILSPIYAVSAFLATRGSDGTSAAFDALVAAKQTLSTRIAGGLDAIVPPASGADRSSAQAALTSALAVSLGDGFALDAIVQVATTVSATFASDGLDAGGHRLAGKALPNAVTLDHTSTLGGVATRFAVDVRAVARLFGATPNLLATGQAIVKPGGGPTWTIGPHDTLATGAATFAMTLDDLAVALAGQAPLFRDGAAVTIDGATAVVAAYDSLSDLADRLATGVSFLAVANQTVGELLTGSIVVAGQRHQITPGTSSLAQIAASLSLSVEQLAAAIATQSALTAGVTLAAIARAPDYTLAASKIDLDAASGRMNLLLRTADPAQYRRLLLDLDLGITGFEYEVAPSTIAPGYQTSEWLHFVTALDAQQPASISTSLGQLDIPVPLRAYPTPPRLIDQRGDATYTDAQVAAAGSLAAQLQLARAWTYAATFETQDAAQDVVWLRIGVNFAPTARLEAVPADPFTALAEFTVNYPAIETDLAALLGAQAATDPKAASAVVALSRIATSIASTWGPIAPDPPSADGSDPLGTTVSSCAATAMASPSFQLLVQPRPYRDLPHRSALVERIEDARVALAVFRTVHGTRRAIAGDGHNLGGIEAVNASSIDSRMKRAGNLEPPDGRSGSADQLRGCGTDQPTVTGIRVFGTRNLR